MKNKLFLINGRLGAGKTTLLKSLIKIPQFNDANIIENEFASVSVDTNTLTNHNHKHDIETIAGLCVCCSTGDELTSALNKFSPKNSTNPTIIEATGVANSILLLEKIINDGHLENFEIAQTFFVMDATEYLDTINNSHDEILAADTLVITKMDLLNNTQQQNLRKEITNLAKNQQIIFSDFGKINPDDVRYKSNILDFILKYNGEQMLDNQNNFTVINLTNHNINPESLKNNWQRLKNKFNLSRAKGNFTFHDRTYHLEATKNQILITETNVKSGNQIVFIGKNAREITLNTILEMYE